jgi:hypothetical protein
MTSERKILKVSFFHALLNAHAPAGPSASSVTMSTPQEQVQCLLWLQSCVILERNMDVNLLHRKAFGSGTTN